MLIGFAGVITHGNLIKKMIGLGIFQVSVLLLYVSSGTVTGGAPPILMDGIDTYINPLPHVLMLTAIVVGVAILAVGLALIVRINEAYGTTEEDEILEMDKKLKTPKESEEKVTKKKKKVNHAH
jgi:multicomponent Na+:H+ antiporter subunit C